MIFQSLVEVKKLLLCQALGDVNQGFKNMLCHCNECLILKIV